MCKLSIASLAFIVSLLTACSPLPEGTVSQRETAAVAQMEKTGVLPELDRSASLGGVDADQNGIRDDIDAWIEGQHYSAPQKKAAQQYARALQTEMVAPLDTRGEARYLMEQVSRADGCIFFSFQKNAYEDSLKIANLTFNTRERILKEEKLSDLINGMTFESYYGKNTCE